MNKAGLFGGGWEDYLDALNDAFDRHVAENAPPHPFGASVDAIMTGYADGPDEASQPAGEGGGDFRAEAVPVNLLWKNPGTIETRMTQDGGRVAQPVKNDAGAPPATEPTEAEVLKTVDEASNFAADLYNRYANKANPPTAEERARDQAKIQQLQGRLTELYLGNLPQPAKAGSSLSNNIMGASLYLLQAAQVLGPSIAIPPAAGGAMFGLDGPPDTMHPGQKIGPYY